MNNLSISLFPLSGNNHLFLFNVFYRVVTQSLFPSFAVGTWNLELGNQSGRQELAVRQAVRPGNQQERKREREQAAEPTENLHTEMHAQKYCEPNM